MYEKKLLYIHTIPVLIDVFNEYGEEILPNIYRMHILDQPLLKRVLKRGNLEEYDMERIKEHIKIGKEVGVSAALVTCSTLSPVVELIKNQVDLPLYQIDEELAKKAIHYGKHIGLLATAQSTLEPSRENLVRQAKKIKKDLFVQSIFIENALSLLESGNSDRHDELILNAINKISPNVDVIVLAQATMARVCKLKNSKNWDIPVLSSPRIVLEQIKENHFK